MCELFEAIKDAAKAAQVDEADSIPGADDENGKTVSECNDKEAKNERRRIAAIDYAMAITKQTDFDAVKWMKNLKQLLRESAPIAEPDFLEAAAKLIPINKCRRMERVAAANVYLEFAKNSRQVVLIDGCLIWIEKRTRFVRLIDSIISCEVCFPCNASTLHGYRRILIRFGAITEAGDLLSLEKLLLARWIGHVGVTKRLVKDD